MSKDDAIHFKMALGSSFTFLAVYERSSFFPAFPLSYVYSCRNGELSRRSSLARLLKQRSLFVVKCEVSGLCDSSSTVLGM